MKLIYKYLILAKILLTIFLIKNSAIQYNCNIKHNDSLEKDNFKLNKNDVYEFIINPQKSICGDDYGNGLLLISIGPSKIENAKERLAARNTWSNKLVYNNIQNLFIVGLSTNSSFNEYIILESERYGDIIQANFIDSYLNLTLKTLSIYLNGHPSIVKKLNFY